MNVISHFWKADCIRCHCVSRSQKDFGQTSAVLHSIPTGSAPPRQECCRPIPPSLYSELKGLLQNMLNNDAIKESYIPIVLVKKKDGF